MFQRIVEHMTKELFDTIHDDFHQCDEAHWVRRSSTTEGLKEKMVFHGNCLKQNGSYGIVSQGANRFCVGSPTSAGHTRRVII